MGVLALLGLCFSIHSPPKEGALDPVPVVVIYSSLEMLDPMFIEPNVAPTPPSAKQGPSSLGIVLH